MPAVDTQTERVFNPRNIYRLDEVGQATLKPVDFETNYYGSSVVLDCRLLKHGPIASCALDMNRDSNVHRECLTG